MGRFGALTGRVLRRRAAATGWRWPRRTAAWGCPPGRSASRRCSGCMCMPVRPMSRHRMTAILRGLRVPAPESSLLEGPHEAFSVGHKHVSAELLSFAERERSCPCKAHSQHARPEPWCTNCPDLASVVTSGLRGHRSRFRRAAGSAHRGAGRAHRQLGGAAPEHRPGQCARGRRRAGRQRGAGRGRGVRGRLPALARLAPGRACAAARAVRKRCGPSSCKQYANTLKLWLSVAKAT